MSDSQRHPTYQRLEAIAQEAAGVIPDSLVAMSRAIGESQGVVGNWAAIDRGVSKAGALKAQSLWGCSAAWILTGRGGKYLNYVDEVKQEKAQIAGQSRMSHLAEELALFFDDAIPENIGRVRRTLAYTRACDAILSALESRDAPPTDAPRLPQS